MGMEADRAKSEVPIERVFRALFPAVALKRHGRYLNFACPHPGHQGKAANNARGDHAVLNLDRNTYFCNGCDCGGSNIDLVMHYQGGEFKDALKFVAEVGGITLEEAKETRLPHPRVAMMNVARKFWKEHPDRAEYHRYWEEGRKLSKEAAERFKPGIAPGGGTLTQELLKMGFTPKQLLDASVSYQVPGGKLVDFFRRRLLVATAGNVVARAIDAEAKPKVLVFQGGYTGLFNAKEAAHYKTVLFVEGVFDAIAVWDMFRRLGLKWGVVAVHGTKAYQAEWVFDLAAAGVVEEYYSCFDMDAWFNEEGKVHAAGQNASLALAKIVRDTGKPCWVVKLPDREDPNDFLKEVVAGRPVKDFKTILDQAVTPWEFALYVDSHYIDASRLAGKVKMLEAAKGHLKTYGVPALTAAWQALADMVNCPVDEVKEYLAETVGELKAETDLALARRVVKRLRDAGYTDEQVAEALSLSVGTETALERVS